MAGKGPTQTTTQNSRSEPWAPTQGLLNNLIGTIGTQYGGAPMNAGGGGMSGMPGNIPAGLPASKQGLLGGQTGGGFDVGLTGAQSGALDTLAGNAQNAGRYAPQIGQLANDLFAGGTDRTGQVQGNLDQYNSRLSPYIGMDTNPYSNEAFTKFTSGLQSDLTDSLKSQYAGAGYSPTSSGDYGQQLGQGIAKGVAPAWMQAYYNNEGMKRGAIDASYGAGNQTAGMLSTLDQTALGNRMQGAGVGQAQISAENAPAMQQLMVEAQRRGIPIQNIAQLSSLIVPMAQLGQQQSGTSETQTQIPMGQQLLGAGLAGAGLLGGIPFPGAGMSLGGGMLAGMQGTLPTSAVFGGSNPFSWG